MTRRRLAALGAVVLIIGLGLVVHLLLPDTALSDIAGDALYAAAVFAFLVAVAPRWRPLWIGVTAAAWCVAVELFQLTGVPESLARGFPPIVLVLGTVFDARDLLVYVVTCTAATAVYTLLVRRGASDRTDVTPGR